MRSFSFSPSPSFRRTFTLTVSPGRNSGKSLRSCASCNFAITGFIFSLFPCRPTQAGPALQTQTRSIPKLGESAHNFEGATPTGSRYTNTVSGRCLMLGGRFFFRNDGPRKPFHLFELRAELEQQEFDPGLLECRDSLSDLLGCPD